MSAGTRVAIGIVLALLAVVGCSRRPEALPEGVTTLALDGRWGKAVRALAKGRDVAFVPPPLAELDGAVWIDRPVKDSLAILRGELAAGEASERALAAPNDSPAVRSVPTSGSWMKTTSPSESWAKSVMPTRTVSSPVRCTHSCSAV